MKATDKRVRLLRRAAWRHTQAELTTGELDELAGMAREMEAELPAPLQVVRLWIDKSAAMSGHVVCVHCNRRVSDEDLTKIQAALKDF